MDFLRKTFQRIRQPWLLNSKQQPDAMLTFAAIGLVVTSICVLASNFKSVSVGTFKLEIEDTETTLLLGYLSATLGAYVLRRNKKDQLEFDTDKKE